MKYLLFPFAVLYGWATAFRNHLYDLRIWKSVEFDLPVIVVGNLAVGGTGKSPMVEYLVRLLLSGGHKPATLSRGYKRKTKGFRLASEQDSATTIGDEPYQFWRKFEPEVPVAVGEDRVMSIPEILFRHENTSAIVCDDAFQHRPLRAGFNILLSTFEKPFFDDHLMPVGRLRESRKGAERADVVVYTKCPSEVEHSARELYKARTREYAREHTPVFFTGIQYQPAVPLFDGYTQVTPKVLLVTGLADSTSIEQYVSSAYELVGHLQYADHQHYDDKQLNEIMDAVGAQQGVSILTTEKDAVKLRKLDKLSSLPVFYLPIEIKFLYEGDKFERLFLESVTRKESSE